MHTRQRFIPLVLTAIITGVVFVPSPAEAQIVNVHSVLATKTKDGLSGALGLNIDWRTGNTDLLLMGLAPVIRYKHGRHLGLVYGKGELGRSNKSRIISRSFEHGRYQIELLKRLLGEIYVQHGYDEFRRIKLRALVGAGPSFKLYATDTYRATAGVSYMLEHERLRGGDEIDAGATYTNHRISAYLMGSVKPNDHTQFVQSMYLQPRINAPGDLRIYNETQVVVKLLKHVALKTSFVLGYDAKPPAEVEPLDTALKSSVTFSF